MKKNLLYIIFPLILFISCIDPICYEYKVRVSIKNIDTDNVRYYVYIKDSNNENEYVVSTYLTRENDFIGTDDSWRMGQQLDYRYPDGDLNVKLQKIKKGGVYTIDEVASDYRGTPKYTIDCTPDDVKEIIDDRLYRCYEITLDWNKRVPISE